MNKAQYLLEMFYQLEAKSEKGKDKDDDSAWVHVPVEKGKAKKFLGGKSK
jgi:hypothetical protein